MVAGRRRRDEREPVRIINGEWVEANCIHVTPRDMEMLKLLARFGLLNSEQLYLLTKGAANAKPFYEISQGQKRCNERIRALYDMHAVNKASPRLPIGEGTSKQYVWLDRAGAKLLGLNRRIRNALPTDYKHTSLVMDLYTSLVVHERHHRIETRYLQPESRQQHAGLIPDLLAIFKYRDEPKGKAIFIEVDRSQKKEADEKAKLERYRNWQTGESWRLEDWCKLLPRPFFPHVLYLFDESRPKWKLRRRSLEKHAGKIGLDATFIGYHEWDGFLFNNKESL